MTSSTMKRQGILTVSDAILAHNVRLALPLEHRVVAITHAEGRSEWLIEGPHMPAVPEKGEPSLVSLCFSQEQDGQRTTGITAWWEHMPEVTWRVSADGLRP